MPLKLTNYNDPAVLNKWADGIEFRLSNLIIPIPPKTVLPQFRTNNVINTKQNLQNLVGGPGIAISTDALGDTVVSATGSVAVPSGTPIIPGCSGDSNNLNWNSTTFYVRIKGNQIVNFPSQGWKIVITAVGGTGAHISHAVVRRLNQNFASTAQPFIDSTDITWGGSVSQTFTFVGAPTASAPQYMISDAIKVPLDVFHDYWIYVFFDTDGGGLNAGLNLWQDTATAGTNPVFILGNNFGGDHTADANSQIFTNLAVAAGVNMIIAA